MDFGQRLKHLRDLSGLTQKQFGAILGVEQNYVSALERGKEIPSERLVKQIASQFHVRVAWLAEGQHPMMVSMEELMAPVLAAIENEGQPARIMLQTILAKAKLYDAEFAPAAATAEDSELFAMISYLRSVWASGNSEERAWLKVQFSRSFSDFRVFVAEQKYTTPRTSPSSST